MIDITQLAAPQVVETLSFEAILAAAKADLADRMRAYLPAIDDILALESEPLVKLLEAHSYRELLFRARVNDAARAHLLAYATGTDLDQLAALFGVLRQPGESDDRLRTRLRLRIAALAAQGTREHYEYHAMTASPLVRAARASQPQPGSVLVMLWVSDSAQAADVRQIVDDALNADTARMLGVVLSVAVAAAHPIDITARITRTRSAPVNLMALLAQRLAQAFDGAGIAAADVARSWVTAVLHVDGVHAVDYPDDAAPALHTAIAEGEYPALGTVTLTDAGVLQ